MESWRLVLEDWKETERSCSYMASVPCKEDLVVLVLRCPCVESEKEEEVFTSTEKNDEEISISAMEIQSWDLTRILRYPVIKVQANRSRLVEHSSYFQILLRGNFSETSLSEVPLQWNTETAIDILQFIYGCPLNLTPDHFLLLLEGALFFGVDALLSECESWFYKITSSKEQHSLLISVDTTIEIWKFTLEHGIVSIPEQCSGYFARNFVEVTSSRYFRTIPYNLLLSSVEHPHLSVHSEKQLCEALLTWLASKKSKKDNLASFSDLEKGYLNILKKIRIHLLPLGYAAGKRRNTFFCHLADKAISGILDLMDDCMSPLNTNTDDGIDNFRIRVTPYSQKVDLEGCVQLKMHQLFLAMLPPDLDFKLKKKTMQFLMNFDQKKGDCNQIIQKFSLIRFCSVQHLDMSKCPQVHIGTVIKFLHVAFPSLRVLKFSHCTKFTIEDYCEVIEKCPLLTEVDLTVDISPVISSQVSVLSATAEECQFPATSPYVPMRRSSIASNITKLTLEGRTDVVDSDLLNVIIPAKLSYINLKGCTSLSDLGISYLLKGCTNIISVIVSNTSFGRSSVLALCSNYMPSNAFCKGQSDPEGSNSISFALQELQMDGCMCIDQASMKKLLSQICMLKNLSLRGTCLSDDALSRFNGIYLEKLDVSDTIVSVEALSSIIRRNTSLKILKMSGCRNLHAPETITSKVSRYDLYHVVGEKCLLEEVAVGWGFSPFSFEEIKPAIRNVKAITLGLGASLSHQSLLELSTICPSLESVILTFQVISDVILRSILECSKYLQVLCLCCCLGDLTSQSIKVSMPRMRILKLERVTPWMTNDDLEILAQNSPNLVELSLTGCKLLNSESQLIISFRWPGLVYLHLEDCGDVMSYGAASIYECKALEDLLLRHSGRGIRRNFVDVAVSMLPLLRKISLDLCDACEGGIDTPGHKSNIFLSTIKIARCKPQRCAFDLEKLYTLGPVHKETVVVEWNSKEMRTTIVKERV